MGIRPKLDRYEKEILHSFGLKYVGLEWLELGCQLHRASKKPAKKIYQRLGVKHTSIDLTGYYGSLKLDLDYPLSEEFLDRFDVITNYGTIEHVNNQYQIFKTVHDSCKCGGIMIHGFPKKETFKGHGRYYYTKEFINKFGEKCGYGVYGLKELNYDCGHKRRLLVVTYCKKNTDVFMPESQFAEIPIYDSGNLEKTGDYIIRWNEKRNRHRLDRKG